MSELVSGWDGLYYLPWRKGVRLPTQWGGAKCSFLTDLNLLVKKCHFWQLASVGLRHAGGCKWCVDLEAVETVESIGLEGGLCYAVVSWLTARVEGAPLQPPVKLTLSARKLLKNRLTCRLLSFTWLIGCTWDDWKTCHIVMNSRKRKLGQLEGDSMDICWGQLLWHQRLHLCNKPLWTLILGHTFAHICHLCFSSKRKQKVIILLVVSNINRLCFKHLSCHWNIIRD